MRHLTSRLTVMFLSGLICLNASAFSTFAQEKPSSSTPLVNDDGNWERYTGKGEAFTALLPAQPTATVTYRPVRFILASEAERYRGTLYSAYSDGVLYLIYSVPRRASEPLNKFVSEFGSRPPRMESNFARDLDLNGISGQRYLIRVREVDGVMDFYVTNNRAYILQVVGGDESNLSIKRFLESFTIGKRDVDDKTADSAVIEIKPNSKQPSQADDTQDSGPVYTSNEVTRKAVIVIRPEPQYTEEARRRRVSGTVILKVVLSSSGKVTNIEAKESLPQGLTEKSFEAARQMKFVPAMKDGKFVSQSVQVEYGFSVY